MLKYPQYDLIIGASGQDGHYLAQQLLNKGHDLIYLDKSKTWSSTNNKISHISILDRAAISDLFKSVSINHIYYLAAIHHGGNEQIADSNAIRQDSLDVHVHGLENVLCSMAQFAPNSRLFYAASSHLFAGHLTTQTTDTIQVSEKLTIAPEGIYAETKALGVELCSVKRKQGIHCSSGFLFNHESARRSPRFLVGRLLNALFEILENKDSLQKIPIQSLEQKVDWGFAPDYTRAMQLIVEQDEPEDYVIGTGKLHSVSYLINTLFNFAGLKWEHHIQETNELGKSLPGGALYANSEKLSLKTGWQPSCDFDNMIRTILCDASIERGSPIQLPCSE